MTSTSRMVLKWFHSLVILCLFLMGMSGQVSYLISISTVMFHGPHNIQSQVTTTSGTVRVFLTSDTWYSQSMVYHPSAGSLLLNQ